MKAYSLMLLSLTLASCSSWNWQNSAKRSLASQYTIYGEWELVAKKELCKDKLIIELQDNKSAVIIKETVDEDGWVLPFKAGDIRTGIDNICGATKIDSAGILTRDCVGDFKTDVGITLKANLNWKLIPVGANGLDYTFVNFQKAARNCQYIRVGAIDDGSNQDNRPVPPPVVEVDLPRVFELPPGVHIRPEPSKPFISGIEEFEYREVSRQSYGESTIGKLTEDLSNLTNQTVKLKTLIAPMKVTYERKIDPCFTIGEGREDPARCNAAIFDKGVAGKRINREVQVGIGTSQDPEINLQGTLEVKLDSDDTLKFSVQNAPENLFVGVTAYNPSSKKVLVKMERPAKAVANLSKTLKAISVSRGIMTIESDLADLYGYTITIKAERNPTIGFNTTILNNFFQVGGRFVTQTVKNGKAIVTIDMKAAINDIGKEEYKVGKKHDFEVTIDLKEKYGSSMKDYTIIKSVKGLSLEPVMKGIYKTKVD